MKAAVVAFLVLSLVLCGAPRSASAATCNYMELRPCAGAILLGSPPSLACCNKLMEQRPCFCEYSKNPQFKPYLNSNNAKNTLATCGVSLPAC